MQKHRSLDAAYQSLRLPRLSWERPARGWERLSPNDFQSEHWAQAPREAKAAFKAILGKSDPGEREIGWGVAIPASDGAWLARAWALFPRSVSVRGARVEIHLNAAALPHTPRRAQRALSRHVRNMPC